MILLNDAQMQDFIVNGYLTVRADLPPAFHESVRAQAESIFTTEGNPGNDILARIPQLADLCAHPAVVGALTSILGPGYAMHPHRHCHLTPPRQPAQRQHQDSYEDDQNVRHHRTRWAMAFYYPQDVPAQMGPTSVLPASQYFTSRAQAESREEILLCGDAGTVTFVHYDLWHRATTNRADRNRFMIKFLFCRMQEPTAPSWNCQDAQWRTPAADNAAPTLWQSVWDWYTAAEQPGDVQAQANRTDRSSRPDLSESSEAECLEEVYRLSANGESGTAALMAALAEEADTSLSRNMAAQHTNPSQLYAAYGLSAQGAAAVPGLVDALRAERWPLRAAAADILGDIGLPARAAVPYLLDCLEDESEWVRRNATEALGVIAASEASPRLARRLTNDECSFVRHNAALSLAKIGSEADAVSPALEAALGDGNQYVRGNARLALARLEK